MSGEILSYGPAGETLDDASFTEIAQGIDASYVPSEAPREEVPFGSFVEENRVDPVLASLSTSTGYTGPNSEESA